ncbi:MAG: AMP-binding protein [Fibrobacteres bacterium]|nr:AMP-binding protein [Fibrobacterota bacterium]
MEKSTAVYTYRLREAALKYSDRPCFAVKRSGEWKRWSYKDVFTDIDLAAAALRDIGVKKNDNCIVIGENTPEWAIAYHAILFCGATVVPIDPNLPMSEIEIITGTVEPKAVFCSASFKELFKTINITILPSGETESDPSFREFINCGLNKPECNDITFEEDDPAAILFTSGTTGSPKGAVLLQRNMVTAGQHGPGWMRLNEQDCAVAILPLHHVFGFVACLAAPLSVGICTVFLPVAKGPLLLEAIKENRVSMLPAVPQMLELLLQNINRGVSAKGIAVTLIFKLLHAMSAFLGPVLGIAFRRTLFASVHQQFGGRLRVILSGGSSIRKATFKAFRRMGFDIAEGYGLTETFGPITLSPVSDCRIGSVGRVLPGNIVKVAEPDTDGNGELRFKGQTVFGGYYQMEEATKEVFDEEGYFKTGDIGHISKDGFIYITGRSKDVIVLESGKNVYPDELENSYIKSPFIEEIAIFGRKNEGRETIAAVIVPSQNVRRRHSHKDSETIIEKELNRLSKGWPSYRKISEWAVSYHHLPRTSTKKIKKNEVIPFYETLRKGIDTISKPLSLTLQEEELMKSQWFAVITELIKELSGKSDNIHPTALLEEDLGLDSMKKVELFARIEEKRGSAIEASEWDKVETAGDLAILTASTGSSSGETTVFTPINVTESNSRLLHYIPGIIKITAEITWKLEVKNCPVNKDNHPLLIYANHESVIDPVIIYSALPWQIRRRTFVIGKAELMSLPLLSEILKITNMIPLDRFGDPRSALNAGREVLKRGYNLLIFPEGTRTRTGEMGQFKSGAARLLASTEAKILPVRLFNHGKVWPVNGMPKLYSRTTKLKVVFGDIDTIQRSAAIDEITATIKDKLLKCN